MGSHQGHRQFSGILLAASTALRERIDGRPPTLVGAIGRHQTPFSVRERARGW